MVSRTDPASDEALLSRMAGGDRSALQTLFARHYTKIYRFAVRRCESEAMAEEIVNDVFLDAWRHAERFDRRSAVSTWLYGIANNKARMAMRARRPAMSGEDAIASFVDGADTPDISSMKQDKAKCIRAGMDLLSADQRAVIDLVYYHEMGLREVSQILGIPENTVKTRLFHARKRLADILIAAGVDWGWP